ncbi:hypothetical protein [Mycolicibacterium fortuitum]|uniref:hypothetical protein n=1 Tax=Mycolicibacterium fortuitum TaxID=1766 RepID=UPI001CE13846|nr:hypothetical protein [Mycolicibacterium fortuitum]MCA4727129.1 hypothetical protein [Mycolicibacterium fortuitum]
MTAPPAAPPVSPGLVWKKLARLIAAPGRTQMRLYNAETEKFSDTGRLTESLPWRSAAVYLYTKERTQVLVLDFDVKHHGVEQVHADLDTAAAWISSCGGAFITDSSTNGGRHLIAPLAIGTSASCDEMKALVRLLSTRLPTLDITPMAGAAKGCISVPGSPDKNGGYRQLDGSLEDALATFTTRSAPDLLPRLQMLLGALKAPQPAPEATTAAPAPIGHFLEGSGDDTRLAADYRRSGELPADVADFATHGILNPKRLTWETKHQARMSVIVNAFARGYSIADLRANIAPGGCWHNGLGHAYNRYQHRADLALGKDFTKAQHWYITNVLNSSLPRHKDKKYTPGGKAQGWRGPKNLREWLANATAWADAEFAGKRLRWTVRAVLQALAFYALVAGEQRSGTWLVGVGGRTLSIGSGLLSEDSVWRVLADLRERPGSPIVLVRQAVGTEADVYALTSQNRVNTDPARAQRVRVEAVHEAWSVIGHHLRRLYELVAYHGLTQKADLYAAAGVPRATGDTMVTALEIAGLLTKAGWGAVAAGHVSLDDIARQHHLDQLREDRLDRHKAERAAWRKWLDDREQQRNPQPAAAPRGGFAPASVGDDHAEEYAAWRESMITTGPDDVDIELEALDLITDVLGGRILSP